MLHRSSAVCVCRPAVLRNKMELISEEVFPSLKTFYLCVSSGLHGNGSSNSSREPGGEDGGAVSVHDDLHAWNM